MLFNLECFIKIMCYGFRSFFRRGIFKFEMILCIGSSLNAIKYFYDRNYFTYFQAFRLFRLIKASPILEDFVWKVSILVKGNSNYDLNEHTSNIRGCTYTDTFVWISDLKINTKHCSNNQCNPSNTKCPLEHCRNFVVWDTIPKICKKHCF